MQEDRLIKKHDILISAGSMIGISFSKGNNQCVCPCKQGEKKKQKEKAFMHSMKKLGYREEKLPNKSDGNTPAGVI